MNKKIMILIVFIFLLTGCASVDYNLEIKKDLSVVESANISATKDFFNSYYMELPISIVRGTYENKDFMSPLINNNYVYELKKNNFPYPSIFTKKSFISLDDYVDNTVYKNQKFENIEILKDNNLITIKTTGYVEYRPDDSDGSENTRNPVSNLMISIKIPYQVTNSNADKVDKSTNTYIWKINEETKEKEINITFDKNKIYIYNLSFYISLGIIIIITIIGVIYIIKKVKKNKNNNYVD